MRLSFGPLRPRRPAPLSAARFQILSEIEERI